MKRKLTVAEQVKKAIRQSGMSAYAICCESGVNEATLSRFLNGNLDPRLSTLDKLADVLGLELKIHKRKGR
jgi:transcriptional regulator with XRE-family HTH domain